jgi:ABC-type lipoprotein release transport system permease subunit
MFLTHAMRLAIYGSAIGLVVAIASSMILRNRIDRLPAGTVAEYVAPLAVLVLSAAIAALIPARMASSIDPARTLRAE